MSTLLCQARILASALVLGLTAFGASEALAVAAPNPSPDQLKVAANAAAQREGAVALECPGAQHARAAGRQYFTLAEAQQCAPGAAVKTDGKLTIQNPLSLPVGFSETAIVKIADGQYTITRVAVPDLSIASNTRGVSAGCSSTGTDSISKWTSDTYIANTTSWTLYVGAGCPYYAHANWVSPSCIAYFPWVCNGSTPFIYNQNSKYATYTDVEDLYGSFCCSDVKNAWQEMYSTTDPSGHPNWGLTMWINNY
jgi:hypothetical protein